MAQPGIVNQRIRRSMDCAINSHTIGELCSASSTSRHGPLCRPVVSRSREQFPSSGIRRISACDLWSGNSKDGSGSCPCVIGTEPDKLKCARSKGTGDGLISSSRARLDQLCRFAARRGTIDAFGCRSGARQNLKASCDNGYRWIANWRDEFQQQIPAILPHPSVSCSVVTLVAGKVWRTCPPIGWPIVAGRGWTALGWSKSLWAWTSVSLSTVPV